MTPASTVWREPLPLRRPTTPALAEIVVTHGEYFDAVRSYIERDKGKMFAEALAQHLQRPVVPGDIRDIRIHLEKHGAFYHPARIETAVGDIAITLVLNVAVSGPGKKHIAGEFQNLKKLGNQSAESFLPRVYAMGDFISGSRQKFLMFLGEWFNDYHEFHICRDPSDNQLKICVWDDLSGRYFLPGDQMLRLYRQAARILTFYYNPATFEHISPWHHAAGDFILKLDQNRLDLKLIAVRGYSPLFPDLSKGKSGAGNAERILQALLIFSIKLSFWMRLDRIDGIGEMVWLHPGIVQSTLAGVLDGLSQKAADPSLPDAIETCFEIYLSICSQQGLLELSRAILRTLQPAAAEITLIQQHLAEHVKLLYQSIQKIKSG